MDVIIDTGKRWEQGIPHHQKAEEIKLFLNKHYGAYWDFGGDGDNGEELLYQLSAFFESKEQALKESK